MLCGQIESNYVASIVPDVEHATLKGMTPVAHEA